MVSVVLGRDLGYQIKKLGNEVIISKGMGGFMDRSIVNSVWPPGRGVLDTRALCGEPPRVVEIAPPPEAHQPDKTGDATADTHLIPLKADADSRRE